MIANTRLTALSPVEPEKLADGRLRVARRFKVPTEYLDSDKLAELVLPAFGTLDNANFGGKAPRAERVFPDCVLVRCGVRRGSGSAGEPPPGGDAAVLELVYEEAADALTQAGPDQLRAGETGQREIIAVFVNKAATAYDHAAQGGLVGTSTHGGGILAEERVEIENAVRRITRRYVVAGLLQATRRQLHEQGLLLVTFLSVGTKLTPTALAGGHTLGDSPEVAHSGGAATPLFEDQVRNLAGLRAFEVTAVMLKSGAAIAADGSDNVTRTYYDTVDYPWPGRVDISTDNMFELKPPTVRKRRLVITEYITTNSDPGDPPYGVRDWCKGYFHYTPDRTGVAISINKAFTGYLSGNNLLTIGETDVAGQSATEVAGTVVSDPAYADFNLDNQVIERKHTPAFVSTLGVQFYTKRTVEVLPE